RLDRYHPLMKNQLIARIEATTPHREQSASNGLDWAVFQESPLAHGVEALLKQRGLRGIEALVGYRPNWAPRKSTFVDHGLAAGHLFVQSYQAARAMSEGYETPLGVLLSLRGADERSLTTQQPSEQPAHVVVCTILLHNLYPRAFVDRNEKTFRTKLSKRESFTYIALLCDSLQPWDRKRLFNQASGNLTYNTYAENFNLEVQGGVLRITERGDQLRIDERQNALRGYLNDYLQGASDLVRLDLA